MTKERWKPIPNYPGYFISSHGRVKSAERTVRYVRMGKVARKKIKERILVLGEDNSGEGYFQVGLCKDGKKVTHKVHLLVAEIFIGTRPSGLLTRHLDGNCKRNHYKNLAYGTHQDNSNDAKKHGTIRKGECHGRAKLKAEQVAWIREIFVARDRKFGGRALGRKFGVTHRVIDEIMHNRTWTEG